MNALCHQCDYDLRGCTGKRCPECGTLIDAWEIHRKAVRRRLNRAAGWSAAFGVCVLTLCGVLRHIEGGFGVAPFILLFVGISWMILTFFDWIIGRRVR